MASDAKRRRALGRGLDALLPSTPPKDVSSAPHTLPIEALVRAESQPRKAFDEHALEELVASIREVGILEPILVRPLSNGSYEIVAGERRWRAAGRAGLHQVPVHVRELSGKEAFEAALIENIQRENLNPVEMAQAFEKMIGKFGHSQESVAARVGKDRSSIANLLRLLKLPPEVRKLVEAQTLSEGHGRALLGLPDVSRSVALAQLAVEKNWSVRETERQVRAQKREKKPGAGKTANVRDLERRLGQALGTRATISDRRGKGYVRFDFASYDDLDRLLEKLGVS